MADTQPFLFEIGTEELPPKSLKKLANALHDQLVIELGKQKLIDNTSKSKVYATPRRLAVYVDALAIKQPDQVIDRKGPAVNQAYDEQGNPTAAALGFARSVGFEVTQLQTQKTDKGEWLYCQINKSGKTAQELLPGCVENALKALPIPKRMRWGALEAEFIRPVKWLVMLLGSEVVEAEILSVKADRFTLGHRFHTTRKLRLREANKYEALLEQEGMVVADFDQRQQVILEDITKLAQEKSAQVLVDENLLDQVTGLVELPVALIGSIDEKFMDLPAAVLISSMQDHQKYFPVVDSNVKMLPYFITVSNIRSKDQTSVVQGNERVLRARLADAQFFWESDQKTTLSDRVASLDKVLFHTKLGSVGDKVKRISRLAEYLAGKLGVDQQLAARAAELCKSDLVTDMVGEFPKLQGTMGKFYAINDNEPPEVAEAIEQHYWPVYANHQIPQSNTGKVLAIADKLDTICGIFATGETPSGDKDPFALRRAALGVVRILIEDRIELDLSKAISKSLEGFSDLGVSKNKGQEIYEFIFERLKSYYQPRGYSTPKYQSVAAVKPVSPLDFHRRIIAVRNFADLDAADSLIEANKRINNILQKTQAEAGEIDVNELSQAQEKALHQRLLEITHESESLTDQNRYTELLKLLAGLKQPIDDFFDNVMVMDENPAKRRNRIALLNQVREHFTKVADVSYLK